MNSFYLSELIGLPVYPMSVKAAKDRQSQEFQDALIDALNISKKVPLREEFLKPVTIFHNEVIEHDLFRNIMRNEYTNIPEDTRIRQFYVSLGIFDLDPKSAVATITRNNRLELTWTERAGKGRFVTMIPPYLVVTSAPTLSYEGGVLDIRVNVKSRSQNEELFVGKLVESKS